MLGPQRRFLLVLTALAVLCAAIQGLTGVSELTLFLAPLFVIGSLLLCGRYIGEEKIVARWRAAVSLRRPRRRSVRWRPHAVRTLRSQLLQGSFGVRAPPVQAAPAV